MLVLLALSANAEAALHKCVDENGKTRYSDVPCPEEQQAEVKPMPGGLNALSLEQADDSLPGVHPSWLTTPINLQDSARCVGRLCTCGDWDFDRSKDEVQRLLNALDALPRLWERYDQLSRELNQGQWQGKSRLSMDGLRRAACEIRIEQKDLVDLYPKLVPSMIEQRNRNLEWAQRSKERCRQPAEPRSNLSSAAWSAYDRCQREANQENREATQKLARSSYTDKRLIEALAVLELARPEGSR